MIHAKTVAMVTGAASGLGAATAKHLLAHGARVLAVDVTEKNDLLQWASAHKIPIITNNEKQQAEEEQINSNGPALVWQPACDVTQTADLTQALDRLPDAFGGDAILNAAINCAGIAPAQMTLSKTTKSPHDLEIFAKALGVNATGTFNVGRLAAQRMTNGGCLVNTASIAAYEGQRGQVAYAASKGAVVSMTLPMARDLAPYSIRVVTIVSALSKTKNETE